VGTKRGTVCVWRNSWWEYWQHDDEPSSLWNASTPLVIRHAHRNDIYALAFVRDGQFLATGGNDNALRLWDLRPAAFEAALLNASRTSGGDVEDDEIAPLAELLPKQGGDVRALAWNGVGGRRLLASGATDESIVIWDLSDSTAPELVVRYDDAHDDDINSLAFSSDCSLLASGSDDTTVKVWRVAGGVRLGGAGSNATSLSLQSLHVLSQHTDSVRAVAWSINGVLATVSADANARLYRQSDLIDLGPSGVLDGELVDSDEEKGDGALDPQPFETLDGRGSLFTSGAWSTDGSQLAMGSAGDRVRVWKKAVELGTFGPQLLELACHQRRDSVRSVAWTHDAFRVATGSTDASVCVWESDGVRGWRHDPGVHALRGHARAVRGLTWSGDGNSLAAADDSGLVTVWTFDGVTWFPRRLENLKGKGAVRSIAFSGDTSLLSAGSFGSTVGVWHLQSNAFAELGGDHVLGLSSGVGAMTADAAADATASWGHTRAVRAVAWAPDDNDAAESPRRWRLASGAADDLILVWELTQIDGTLNLTRVPAVLKGHTTTVRSLEWSVEGRLASSSDDDTVRVWDELDSDEQSDTVSREFDVEDESTNRRGWRSTLTLAGHQSNVRSVSWSPRGTHIASAGLDSTVMIWPVSADAVKNAGAPDAWRIDEDCRWSRWLHTATVKLACARQSPVEGYSFEMDMLMVDFRQQSKLLRQMTYGQLNSADLAALGYPMLGWVLDLVPRPEHNLPDGVSVDFLPLLPGSGLPFAELGDLAGNLSRSGAFDTFIRPSFIGNETLNY
jgi:WD40 repeat protein